MNAPFPPRSGKAAPHNDCGADLAAMIDTWTKRQIIDAYSFGFCTEALAIQLIYEHGLRYA